jgi:hypothetical protein
MTSTAGLFYRGSAGHPMFFPSLFGSGKDGELTLTTTADVGYLGSYGAKQAVNATLAAGQTLTIATGTSSGALMIACTGKLTIAGTITGDGQNGSNAAAAGASSGKGGDTAGGGVGGAAVTGNANGNVGTSPTKLGHGAGNGTGLGRGGNSGAHLDSTGNGTSNTVSAPILSSGSTYSDVSAMQGRLIHPSDLIGGVRFGRVGLTGATGTAASSGTVAAVNPTTNDVGPWAQTASGLWLPLDFIPGGVGGFGGGITSDGSGNDAAGGGGGGGGGCVIFEADTIELVSGYAINLRGGNGGNGTVQGGTSTAQGGAPGWGGVCLLICRTLIGSTGAINCNAGSVGTGAGAGVATPPSGIAGGVYVIKV